MAVMVNGVMHLVCEWFVRCENPTLLAVKHPVLGYVPCCVRCADKMSIPHDERTEIEIVG